MSQCPSCGLSLTGTPRFCTRCGTRLQAPRPPAPAPLPRRVCTACGVTWPLQADFCGQCGKSFRGKPPAKPEPPKCVRCGRLLPPGRRSCGTCGQIQPEDTPCACGKPLRTGSLYCGSCGRERSAPPAENERLFRGVPLRLLREDRRPATIGELTAWCAEAKITPERHGFHVEHGGISGDYTLRRTEGRFAFCRVTDRGENHVYYLGRNEAFAVNGFWHTLLNRLGMWPLPEEYAQEPHP